MRSVYDVKDDYAIKNILSFSFISHDFANNFDELYKRFYLTNLKKCLEFTKIIFYVRLEYSIFINPCSWPNDDNIVWLTFLLFHDS